MPKTSLVYRAAVRLGVALSPALTLGPPKLGDAIRGRRGVIGRLQQWATAHRDRSRPLLWLHAPSRGEGLQAEAVLRRIKANHPDWQVAYTWFSPSAVPFATHLPVDVGDYLPWDRRSDVDAALDALQPSALVFAKLDLWPELVTRTVRHGAPVGIIAATVSPKSSRLGGGVRRFLRPGYAVVSRAGAVSDADAERLARLGVPREVIEVTGDPRYDSALERVRAIMPDDPLRAIAQGTPTLVAGSTWPPDEDALLKAFGAIRVRHPEARLVLVPHEPLPAHLHRIELVASRLGLPAPVRLDAASPATPLVVVDQVGILAELYLGGRMAYVGGGFGTAGLHSVVEPAACGVPVLFGPAAAGNRDAVLLLEAGAGHIVGADLAQRWGAWLDDGAGCDDAGRRALAVIRSGLGAADRSAKLVESLMMD